MGQVNLLDDNITRYVVRYYGFDFSTKHYTHKVVAVLDNKSEFKSLLKRLQQELEITQKAFNSHDNSAYYSGIIYPPGYLQKKQNRRTIVKAMNRGVNSRNLNKLISIEGQIESSIFPAEKPMRDVWHFFGPFCSFWKFFKLRK